MLFGPKCTLQMPRSTHFRRKSVLLGTKCVLFAATCTLIDRKSMLFAAKCLLVVAKCGHIEGSGVLIVSTSRRRDARRTLVETKSAPLAQNRRSSPKPTVGPKDIAEGPHGITAS